MTRRNRFTSLTGGVLLLMTGCDATLSGIGNDNDGRATDPSSPVAGQETKTAEEEEAERIAQSLPWPAEFDGRGVLARRLSRDELVISASKLIGVAPERESLPQEPRSGHGLLLTGGLSYIDSEIHSLWTTISDFAAEHSAEIFSTTGCGDSPSGAEACLTSWAQDLAGRAFRKPVASEDQSALAGLVTNAGAGPEDAALAVESVLKAILFSPSFLFRFETGVDAPVDGELTDWEIAERLSFLATLGPPDTDLAAAAAAGTLRTAAERESQYQRLAATPQGALARAVFVLEWLNANESKVNLKSAEYREGLPASFADDIRQSAELTISGVLNSTAPTIAELFSTTEYLAHPAVQLIMADAIVAGRPNGDSAGANRAGVLMHPYVIAAHTKENGSSPFQVGIALREAVLCSPVSAPPPGAQDKARTDPPPDLTQREELEYITSAESSCSNCHAQFAPIGYAFLAFDPLGRWQSTDPGGAEWDLTGDVPSNANGVLEFTSPTDLGTQLGQHPQVLGCFTQAVVQWTFGRRLVPADAPLVERLNAVSQGSIGDFPLVFQGLVSSPEFIQVTHPSESL